MIAGGAGCAEASGQKGLKTAQHLKAKPGTRQKTQRITLEKVNAGELTMGLNNAGFEQAN